MLRFVFALVVWGMFAAPDVRAQVVRPVRLTTPDNVVIIGDYYTVTQTNAPAVIFLPGLKQRRMTWTLMAEALQKRGIAVVAIDLRGQGDSLRRITAYGAQMLDVNQFTAQDVQAMMMDLEAAYGWLEKQTEIDPKRIGMVGSSVSANLVIRYAAINDQLAALVLLSPSLDNAFKLRTDDAIKQIGNIPMRFIVSRNDAFYFNSAKRLLTIRHEMGLPVTGDQLVVCTGSLHGTDMLVGVKTLPNQVIDFLEASLKQPPLPAAPAPHGTPAPAPTPPAEPTPAPAP